MSIHSQEVPKYDDIARTLAAVAISLRSYSLIDRLANALSPDAVYRAIYEMSRNLDAIAKAGDENYIRQFAEDWQGGKRQVIEIGVKGEKPSKLFGGLAAPSRMHEFLEESNRNIRMARSVASYAMYLVANSAVRKQTKEATNQ